MVKVGEELTVHYMMDMETAPDWYLDAWDKHSAQNIEEEEKLLQIYCIFRYIYYSFIYWKFKYCQLTSAAFIGQYAVT